MPEKSPGASYSAFLGNISRDLLGGLSNSNQILCCLTMPTSIPVCSGVQLTVVTQAMKVKLSLFI